MDGMTYTSDVKNQYDGGKHLRNENHHAINYTEPPSTPAKVP
jgi:hypothetical protein